MEELEKMKAMMQLEPDFGMEPEAEDPDSILTPEEEEILKSIDEEISPETEDTPSSSEASSLDALLEKFKGSADTAAESVSIPDLDSIDLEAELPADPALDDIDLSLDELTFEEPVIEEAPAELSLEEPVAEEAPVELSLEEPVTEEVPVELSLEEPVIEEAPAEPSVDDLMAGLSLEEPVAEETPVEISLEEPVVEDSPVELSLEEPVTEETPVEISLEEPVIEEPADGDRMSADALSDVGSYAASSDALEPLRQIPSESGVSDIDLYQPADSPAETSLTPESIREKLRDITSSADRDFDLKEAYQKGYREGYRVATEDIMRSLGL